MTTRTIKQRLDRLERRVLKKDLVYVHFDDRIGYYQVEGRVYGWPLGEIPEVMYKDLEEEGGHLLTEDQVRDLEKNHTVLVFRHIDMTEGGYRN